jgi:hypothetical protein
MTKDFDKYLEDYKTMARNSLMFVYPTELRNVFEKAVDLQVESSRTFAKVATDHFSKFVPAGK